MVDQLTTVQKDWTNKWVHNENDRRIIIGCFGSLSSFGCADRRVCVCARQRELAPTFTFPFGHIFIWLSIQFYSYPLAAAFSPVSLLPGFYFSINNLAGMKNRSRNNNKWNLNEDEVEISSIHHYPGSSSSPVQLFIINLANISLSHQHLFFSFHKKALLVKKKKNPFLFFSFSYFQRLFSF